jgi:hypothetical protein
MNERIKELAEQCWDKRLDGLHFDQEKFAKLIVKECCQKLEDDGMVEVAMEMKQHFGVEE